MINEALVEAAKLSMWGSVELLLERSEIDGISRALKSCNNEVIKVLLGIVLLRKEVALLCKETALLCKKETALLRKKETGSITKTLMKIVSENRYLFAVLPVLYIIMIHLKR